MLCLVLLAGLAPWSLAMSALPLVLSVPVGLCATGASLWLARREARRPALTVSWPGGEAAVIVWQGGAEETWTRVRVHLRGPLATLAGRDGRGRRRCLAWWPDTLTVATRRQLRLAVQVSRHSGKPLRQMAA